MCTHGEQCLLVDLNSRWIELEGYEHIARSAGRALRSGFRDEVSGFGVKVQGIEFRVEGSGFRDEG